MVSTVKDTISMLNLRQAIIDWFVTRQSFDYSEHPKPLNMCDFAIGRLSVTFSWGSMGTFVKEQTPLIRTYANRGILSPGFVVYFRTRNRPFMKGTRLQNAEYFGVRLQLMNDDFYQHWLKSNAREHLRSAAKPCHECGRVHPPIVK